MKTDYKIWFIRRDNDGFIEVAAVRFYEGDYVDEQIRKNPSDPRDKQTKTASIYRRTRQLGIPDLAHLSPGKALLDHSGKECICYDSGDFGRIKTDDELTDFLNGKLALDPTRIPIEVQTTTTL